MANLTATLSTAQWLTLPQEVRSKLIEIFQIHRSGVGHSNLGPFPNQTSDGYTYEDLKAIGVDSMRQYLNSDQEDFFVLFNEVVAKLNEPKLTIKDFPIETGAGKLTLAEPESDSQVKERWTKVIKDLKVEAGQKGLLSEFNKILRVLVKN